MGRLRREVWKMNPEFIDYEVSDRGRIRRRTAGKPNNTWIGKILKPEIRKNGYSYIVLYVNGKRKGKLVHRLVLETFVGPCPEGHECNHKHEDGNKTRNTLWNLEWVTRLENSKHAWENGLNKSRGEENTMSKLKEGEVCLIKKLLLNKIPQSTIAKMFKVTQANISTIKHEKTWRHI